MTSVKVNLFMNDDPAARDARCRSRPGVYPPEPEPRRRARCSLPLPTGLRHVLLNGSTSSDPEGDPLDYYWFVNGVEVGQAGSIFDYAAPSGGTYEFRLDVRDPSGLLGRSRGRDGGAPVRRDPRTA